MPQCSACSVPLASTSRFCSSCGAAQDPSLETITLVKPAADTLRSAAPTVSPGRARQTAMGRLHLSDALHQARFLPGMVVVDRYRIVGLLGKGGMGEVYRADDLKLGQAVALKFLPELLGSSSGRVEMFYEEVRLARQVSHPHVCRVYDVGEIEGAPFLTMEYIDGEDLASLLRRIGRLPQERAVAVARQMCAGLAAIHDKGILHRDLKPANVMLDGRGSARITDFGLAALAGGVAQDMMRSGTPAYMAPEQLAGQEPTPRSEVYALGLVLYEIFTGRSAFEADSIDDLTRKRRETRPDPSSQVHNLDPVVEAVLLRCLENDPRDRPSSPLAVAAALPGGDPLAAALAAGETPSPEMVAAGGEPGALSLPSALVCAVIFLLSLAAVATMAGQTLLGLAPVRKAPAALEERAHQVLEALGYDSPPADTAHDLAYDVDYLRWIETTDTSPRRWDALKQASPAPIFYYLRQSPRALDTLGPARVVRFNDPPLTVAGMTMVVLDTEGRLMEFHAVPPQVEEPASAATPRPPVTPERLFEMAGLDMARFTPTASTWTPLMYADRREAWEGPHPVRKNVTVRVESAFYRGQPVYFEIVGPWSRAVRAQVFEANSGARVAQVISIVLVASVLGGALSLARRNLKLGRGDRRGAMRAGVAVFLMTEAVWLLRAHHSSSAANEWNLVVWGIAIGLFQSGLMWLLYLALEPFVRRRWPDSIVSWTRLLAGWWRDPRIGRDVLVGASFGLMMAVVDRLRVPLAESLGMAPSSPILQPLDPLVGPRFLITITLTLAISALVQGPILLFLMFLGRWRSNRGWMGAAIFFGIATLMQTLLSGAGPLPVNLGLSIVMAAALTVVLARFGLLATISCIFFQGWAQTLIIAPSSWYASVGVLGALLPLILAGFGFTTSLGRRPPALRAAIAD